MEHGLRILYLEGSEFTVRLPFLESAELIPVETGPEQVKPGGLPPDEAENPAIALRVFVVDDNDDSASSLAELIQIWGHENRRHAEAAGIDRHFTKPVELGTLQSLLKHAACKQ